MTTTGAPRRHRTGAKPTRGAPRPTAARRLPGDDGRIPRALHPIAWWIWAIGLAVAVTRTTNPLLLAEALAALGLVVAARRGESPWARAFKYYLGMALIVIAIRVVFRSIFATGVTATDHVLVTLPAFHTPAWYAGIAIGGPVSLEATLSAIVDGMRLGAMLCCLGAAVTLANPKRALKVLPGALYELGAALVVAITFAPQLVESVQRVRRARRLRGGGQKGVRALRSILIPVLEDALERALSLAAAMDSRGYGRTGTATATSRRITAALMLGGMAALCAGAYGLLDPTAPRCLGVPAFVAGALLCCAGLALGGRRVRRSSYRPDPWGAPEWIVCACGVGCAVAVSLRLASDAAALMPSFYPLQWPPLPLAPAAAILIGALGGLAAPPPPRLAPVAGTVR